ncbi:transglutaminase domain-containing protein [Streptomyces xanthophaeus]|uniref:transglutaminase domain-containing protein n=1 Tax=Streptomyces xanthophaeus TaxID=67385 RepID=UPI003439ED4E
MTSSLLRPRGRARTAVTAPPAAAAAGSTAPTPILDWRHPRVTALVRELAAPAARGDVGAVGAVAVGAVAVGAVGPARGAEAADPARQIEALRRAHRWISSAVRPVYSVQDERPVSEILRLGRGSCSQRLAVLESVARASGVATRVRGLLVDGTFWDPRFPHLRRIVPDQVLLAWPEFRLGDPAAPGGPAGSWLPVSELFGGLHPLDAGPGDGFTNAGAETLFEALSRTAIDWDAAPACPASGADAGAGAGPACDLSAYVLTDLGHHDSRDELFARHGQTLCPMARLLAEPVLGRRAAGAA